MRCNTVCVMTDCIFIKELYLVLKLITWKTSFQRCWGCSILEPPGANLGISPSKCKRVYLVNVAVVRHWGLVWSKTRARCHFQDLLATLKKHRKVEYQGQITLACVSPKKSNKNINIPNTYVEGGLNNLPLIAKTPWQKSLKLILPWAFGSRHLVSFFTWKKKEAFEWGNDVIAFCPHSKGR